MNFRKTCVCAFFLCMCGFPPFALTGCVYGDEHIARLGSAKRIENYAANQRNDDEISKSLGVLVQRTAVEGSSRQEALKSIESLHGRLLQIPAATLLTTNSGGTTSIEDTLRSYYSSLGYSACEGAKNNVYDLADVLYKLQPPPNRPYVYEGWRDAVDRYEKFVGRLPRK